MLLTYTNSNVLYYIQKNFIIYISLRKDNTFPYLFYFIDSTYYTSIKSMRHQNNIYIYICIKQWRFELRTPLPKRGAQPLGHLPDKFEK